MNQCGHPRCKLTPWRGRLCYTHYRESQGEAFDRTLGKFAKASIQFRTAGRAIRQVERRIPVLEKAEAENGITAA